jgi:hypothetical protein
MVCEALRDGIYKHTLQPRSRCTRALTVYEDQALVILYSTVYSSTESEKLKVEYPMLQESEESSYIDYQFRLTGSVQERTASINCLAPSDVLIAARTVFGAHKSTVSTAAAAQSLPSTW